MWIFTQSAFLSIVQDKADPDLLLVRARVKGDIEKHFRDAIVFSSPDHDYAYRSRLSRSEVAAVIAQTVLDDLDYDNFKASIKDHRRSAWYLRVWAAMAEMQEKLKGT
jgi:hypothetical protein